jgi:hypothetical protein
MFGIPGKRLQNNPDQNKRDPDCYEKMPEKYF